MRFYVVLPHTSELLEADENFKPLKKKPANSEEMRKRPLTKKPPRRTFEP